MANSIRSIALEKLIAHPDNPNRMSNANFGKLVRNIEQTGRYEPITVRPHPQRKDCFQIINGYHRCYALTKLGYKTADCIVWNIDDEQTDILLATLNRLGGSDNLDKKIGLLKRLNKRMESAELAKLLPTTAKQIERLVNLKRPKRPASINPQLLMNPMVFFVNDAQQETIENALSLVQESHREETMDSTHSTSSGQAGSPYKAARRATALAQIAEHFLNHSKFNSRT